MRRNLAAIIAALSTLALGGIAFGQSLYLDKGQSGGLIGANYYNGDGFMVYAGDCGYSLGGVIDIGMSLSHSTIDDGDLVYNSIAPYVTANFIKPTSGLPLAVEIQAGYETGSYSSLSLDEQNRDMKASGYSFGARVYAHVDADSRIDLYPYIGVFHSAAEIEIKDSSGNTETEDTDSTPIQFGAIFLLNQVVTINAGLSTSDGNSTYVVGAGIFF